MKVRVYHYDISIVSELIALVTEPKVTAIEAVWLAGHYDLVLEMEIAGDLPVERILQLAFSIADSNTAHRPTSTGDLIIVGDRAYTVGAIGYTSLGR